MKMTLQGPLADKDYWAQVNYWINSEKTPWHSIFLSENYAYKDSFSLHQQQTRKACCDDS